MKNTGTPTAPGRAASPHLSAGWSPPTQGRCRRCEIARPTNGNHKGFCDPCAERAFAELFEEMESQGWVEFVRIHPDTGQAVYRTIRGPEPTDDVEDGS